jgi:hypothetical protein
MSSRARRTGPTPILVPAAAAGAALLAAFLVAGAACSPQVTDTDLDAGQGDCPAESPFGGEPCGAPALCVYPGTGCGRSFACSGDVWQETGDVCPVPEAGACPSAIPTTGAPCSSAGQSCTFDVPGECPGVFVATCGAAGEWAVEDQSPPCAPHPCPAMEPTAGATCDYPYACTYTVVPPGCSPETQNASCVNGLWIIDVPACMP